jgi:hypothetical protein
MPFDESMDAKKTVTFYSFDGPENRDYSSKKCKYCPNIYFFSNYTQNNDYFLYDPSVDNNFIRTSIRTCFDLKLVKYFDEQIVRSGVTFEGFADTFNSLFKDHLKETENTRCLDRRRVGEAWYFYKVFKILHFLSILNLFWNE